MGRLSALAVQSARLASTRTWTRIDSLGSRKHLHPDRARAGKRPIAPHGLAEFPEVRSCAQRSQPHHFLLVCLAGLAALEPAYQLPKADQDCRASTHEIDWQSGVEGASSRRKPGQSPDGIEIPYISIPQVVEKSVCCPRHTPVTPKTQNHCLQADAASRAAEASR